MSALNETDVRRQKPGQPAGGQFAEKERGASGLALAPAPAGQFDEEAVADVLRELYGDHPVAFSSADTHCPAGRVIRSATMTLPEGHSAILQVTEETSTGQIVEVNATSSWPMTHLGYDIDDGVTTWKAEPDGMPAEKVADLARSTQKRAELQRAVNDAVNIAQEKAAYHENPRDWHRTLRAHVHDVTDDTATILFEDHRSRGGQAKRIFLDVDRSTGQICGGQADTGFGVLPLAPEGARKAAESVDREMSFALGDYEGSAEASTQSFEQRFGTLVRQLPA